MKAAQTNAPKARQILVRFCIDKLVTGIRQWQVASFSDHASLSDKHVAAWLVAFNQLAEQHTTSP
jgi:hypothetical protein